LNSAAKKDVARLFFALWPSPEVRDVLAALARDVNTECGGRATRADKIHLTLFFVGDVELNRLPDLQPAAEAVRGEPFEFVVDRLGYFRRARIAWAGAACPPALASLVAQLTENLASRSFAGEDRPYVPHITLVREAPRKPARSSIDPVIWRVRDFVLVQSGRGPDGSSYEILERWKLK
jgi:RNA 2',3'-cyclic 3'-phosphodiesterase